MPVATAPTKKKTKKTKRHRVDVGDMVMFYTPNTHMYGTLGRITNVLDDKHVVVKCLAPNDEDYGNQLVVLRTSEPQGQTPNGEDKWRYSCYITKVVVRVAAAPPPKSKKPKQVLPAKVIETQQELLEHLESDSRQKVVLQLDRETA